MSLSRNRRAVFSVIVAGIAAIGSTTATFAGDLIFADVLNVLDVDGNSIRKVGTDGNGLQTLVPTGGGVRGVDVDTVNGKIYWTDVDNFVIRRANLNGTNQEDIITSGLIFPSALRINQVSGRFFWGEQDELIRSATLAGGDSMILTTTIFNRGIALDTVNNKMYWTTSVDASTGRILRANFDGSGEEIIIPVSGIGKPGNLAIDVAGGKIYWSDPIARRVKRANLDGTSVQTIFPLAGVAPGRPKGITLDLATGTVYFGMDIEEDEAPTTGLITRMDLNGNNPQGIIAGLGSVNDLVFVATTIPPRCVGDFNNSGGQPTVQDIFDFLSAYFSNDPRADVNNSGGNPTVQDIFDFLAAYFMGCP